MTKGLVKRMNDKNICENEDRWSSMLPVSDSGYRSDGLKNDNVKSDFQNKAIVHKFSTFNIPDNFPSERINYVSDIHKMLYYKIAFKKKNAEDFIIVKKKEVKMTLSKNDQFVQDLIYNPTEG